MRIVNIDREKALARAKERVKESFTSDDYNLVHSVNTSEETVKIINLMFERLDEWYKMYYPELKTKNTEQYCYAVLGLDLENPEKSKFDNAVSQDTAKRIISRVKNTMGAKLGKDEEKELRELAKKILELIEYRKALVKYFTKKAEKIAPNLSYIVGPELGAKFVATAGGLKKLALMPASTIQVIGAEKALFKHLRTGSRPPKHGLLFQLPQINKAPKKLRGKIARLYAGKLSMAIKADEFTGNFIAKELKQEIEDKIKRIRA